MMRSGETSCEMEQGARGKKSEVWTAEKGKGKRQKGE